MGDEEHIEDVLLDPNHDSEREELSCEFVLQNRTCDWRLEGGRVVLQE